MDWIPVGEIFNVLKSGETSPLFFVAAAEFGYPPQFYVCRAWIGSTHPLEVKWYLDEDFYHLDHTYEVGGVYVYMPIPVPPPAPTLKDIYKQG
jgi:hypothetical protein